MTFKFTSLAAALIFATSASATEIVHYDNKPVTVHLVKGEERMIQFGDHVQVGVSRSQEAQQLFRVQSAQGAVHILPNKVFDRERVQIKRMNDGRVLLLDLVSVESAADSQPMEDMRIYLENENTLGDATPEDTQQQAAASQRKVVTPITLTRYAAQKLYAPTRIHTDNPAITEANLNQLVNKSVRAFKGINRVRTESQPVLAYRSGDLYVAALLVRNTTHNDVKLNYLDINLPFSHATFQHHKLSRMGTAGDRTILYLVNNRPLTETLVPWTFYDTSNDTAEEGAK